jgi:hypothetical protein
MSAIEPGSLPGIYTNYYPKEYEAYNTQWAGQIERVGWMWWDTQTYVSGTTTQLTNWFNLRATRDLSNMEVAFQLAAPKAFLIRAFRFFVKQRPRAVTPVAVTGPQTGAFDNIAQLINTGTWRFVIGNKDYAIDPLWALTAGGGAAGSMCMATSAGGASIYVDYAQNGIADPRAVYTLSTPIFLAPQINFTAEATWPAALTLAGGDTTISFALDGDLLRPVQ